MGSLINDLKTKVTDEAKRRADELAGRDAIGSAMRNRLEQARSQAQAVGSSFHPLAAEAAPTAGANPLFAQQRTQLSQRFNAQNQQNQDALKRRFAALGGLNSGAAIKTMENADAAAGQAREEAMQNLNAAEAQDTRQEQQAAQGRNFQREMANQDNAFRAKVYSADSAAKFAQLDQALEEFFINREATSKNFDLAKKQADSTGGLFGGGGFLGLGIG